MSPEGAQLSFHKINRHILTEFEWIHAAKKSKVNKKTTATKKKLTGDRIKLFIDEILHMLFLNKAKCLRGAAIDFNR